jgi:hypothetical protein
MRDPTTRIDDPLVAVAIKETRSVLRVWQVLGGLRDGVEMHPDFEIRSKARVELTRPDIKGKLSNDVLRYLYVLVSDDRSAPPPKRKGRRRNTVRDQMLVDMIAHIKERHGIDPTRNRSSMHDHYSGCAIISQVLGELGIDLEEEGIEEVWRQMGHRAEPNMFIREILAITPDQMEWAKGKTLAEVKAIFAEQVAAFYRNPFSKDDVRE